MHLSLEVQTPSPLTLTQMAILADALEAPEAHVYEELHTIVVLDPI